MAWQQKLTFPIDRLKCISDRFEREKIGLKYFYLNAGSKNIYSLM